MEKILPSLFLRKTSNSTISAKRGLRASRLLLNESLIFLEYLSEIRNHLVILPPLPLRRVSRLKKEN